MILDWILKSNFHLLIYYLCIIYLLVCNYCFSFFLLEFWSSLPVGGQLYRQKKLQIFLFLCFLSFYSHNFSLCILSSLCAGKKGWHQGCSSSVSFPNNIFLDLCPLQFSLKYICVPHNLIALLQSGQHISWNSDWFVIRYIVLLNCYLAKSLP